MLSPEEADRIADSIRPSWEPPPPSVRLAATTQVAEQAVAIAVEPALNPVHVASERPDADPLSTTAPSQRADADRTLTNDELRALEQRKRRAVPESSYREERSPSAPPERVEKHAPDESIIVDPVVLAAPPPQFAPAARLPTNLGVSASSSAIPSADATVVIPPENVDHLRPKRAGLFAALGAVAALASGGVYFATTLHGEPTTNPAVTPQVVAATQTAALGMPTTAAVPPPATPPVTSPVPDPAAKPSEHAAKTTEAKKPGVRHENTTNAAPPQQPPPPKQAVPPKTQVGGGDKGKLVRDVPF